MMMKASDSSSLVYLNVGGKKFCTYNDTLTRLEPNSMLAAMFSGRHSLTQDQEGYTFIDRDGEYFGYILNWLRDGDVPSLEDFKYPQLLKEARYFQLQGLIDGISDVLDNKREEKSAGEADLTRTDIIKMIIQTKSLTSKKFKGVNLSGLDLSGLDLSYMDFSYACMKNVCFTKADLTRAKLDYVDAKGANFNEANLHRCSFVGTNLDGVSAVDTKDDYPYPSFEYDLSKFVRSTHS